MDGCAFEKPSRFSMAIAQNISIHSHSVDVFRALGTYPPCGSLCCHDARTQPASSRVSYNLHIPIIILVSYFFQFSWHDMKFVY